MPVFISFRTIITGLRGFFAMMKIPWGFYLQEKSITLRLFQQFIPPHRYGMRVFEDKDTK